MKAVLNDVMRYLDPTLIRTTEAQLARLLRESALEDEETWLHGENLGLAMVVNLEARVHEFNPDEVSSQEIQVVSWAASTLWSTAQRRFLLKDVHEAAFLAINAGILFLYTANLSGATAIGYAMARWPIKDSIFILMRELLRAIHQFPLSNENQVMIAVRAYYQSLINHQNVDIPKLYKVISNHLDIDPRKLNDAHLALIYRLQQVLPWLGRFLLPNLLEGFLEGNFHYTHAIRHHGPYFISPGQRQALLYLAGLPRANTLVLCPSNSEKSLIGEIIAIKSLLTGDMGVAIYIIPNRSRLTRTLKDIARRLESSDVTLISHERNNQVIPLNLLRTRKTLLVVTPEEVDTILRSSPWLVDHLVSIVIDELYPLGQIGCGAVLECLISQLCTLQRTHSFEIVAMSAVLNETTQVQQWLNISASHVVDLVWSPSRTRFTIQLPNNHELFYSTHTRSAASIQWLPSYALPKSRGRKYLGRMRKRTTSIDRTALLAKDMYAKVGGPMLIVCSNPKETLMLAHGLVKHFSPASTDGTIATTLTELLKQSYPHHQTLIQLLSYRICYYNHNLETDILEMLQNLIQERYFHIVVATEQLVEDTDTAFRAIILHRLVQRSSQYRPGVINRLLVRDMIGRSGQSSMFIESDMLFADHPVDDLIYGATKQALVETTYIDPSTLNLQSSLVIDRTNHHQGDTNIVKATLEAAFLALVQQHGSVRYPAEKFADHLFCDQQMAADIQQYLNHELFKQLTSSAVRLVTTHDFRAYAWEQQPLVAVHEEPQPAMRIKQKQLALGLMGAQSSRQRNLTNTYTLLTSEPSHTFTNSRAVRLTAYGQIAVHTRLSMYSATRIVLALSELSIARSTSSVDQHFIQSYHLHWNSWLDTAFVRLRELPELARHSRAAMEAGLKDDDQIFELLWAWYSGWSLPAIVWLLYYRNTDPQSTIAEWLRDPTIPHLGLENRIGSIAHFCQLYFAQAWSQILDAVHAFMDVSVLDNRVQALLAYRRLLPCVSRGVNSPLAAMILDLDLPVPFPGNRTHAQILATWYDKRHVMRISDIGSTDLPTAPALMSITLDPVGISRMDETVAKAVCAWLNTIKDQHPHELEKNTMSSLSNSEELSDAALEALIAQCQRERARYRVEGIPTSAACMQIVRHAFQGQEAAWAALYRLYESQLRAWVRTQSTTDPEEVIQIVWQGFSRTAPQRPTLIATDDMGPVMAYLKACTKNAVLQVVRKDRERIKRRGMMPLVAPSALDDETVEPKPSTYLEQSSSPEQIERIQHLSLDSTIHLPSTQNIAMQVEQNAVHSTVLARANELVSTEQERIVVRCRLKLWMTPKEIMEMYRDQFASMEELRAVIQRVTRRLSQDPRIRELLNR